MYDLNQKELFKMRDRLVFFKTTPFIIVFTLLYQSLIYLFYKIIVGIPDVSLFSILRISELSNVFSQTFIDKGNFIQFIFMYLLLFVLFLPLLIIFYTDLKFFVYERCKLQESKKPLLFVMLIVFPLFISFGLIGSNPDIEKTILLSKYNFITSLFYCFAFYQFFKILIKLIFNFKLYLDYLKSPRKYDKIVRLLYRKELKKTNAYIEKCEKRKKEEKIRLLKEKKLNKRITNDNI